jgi:hypothetical protein
LKATVVAIDATTRTVRLQPKRGEAGTLTLQLPNGEIWELDVAKDRDLSRVGLGDSLRIQFTEAIVIEVVKP